MDTTLPTVHSLCRSAGGHFFRLGLWAFVLFDLGKQLAHMVWHVVCLLSQNRNSIAKIVANAGAIRAEDVRSLERYLTLGKHGLSQLK
jgi:hypothetical protein